LGVLFATKCVAAAWQYAQHLGVAHVTPFRAAAIRRDAGGAGGRVGEVVVEGEDGVALRARSVVFAPGAWLSPLAQALFGLSVPTRVTAETVCYYRPTDASKAAGEATRRLDDGFFKVRFDRLTPKEREYVIAMAKLGAGPYRSSDVAAALNETHQSLGPRRAQIISKGMIYSPSHGDIAFTVPMFNEYLIRNYVKTSSKG
jgi:glycine/D-amino acid oxidase-like deaminating enzyme